MKKISTLFKKNPKDLGLVIDEINPENAWALTDDAIATRKHDGHACRIENGQIEKRLDVRKGKKAPEGAIPCQEADPITGHHPHWVKCDRDDPSDKYFFLAYDALENKEDGTYELLSENFQGRCMRKNPENIKGFSLVRHGSEVLTLPDKSFEGIKKFLEDNFIEGIVFHHKTDGRMCKIKRSNFGIDW